MSKRQSEDDTEVISDSEPERREALKRSRKEREKRKSDLQAIEQQFLTLSDDSRSSLIWSGSSHEIAISDFEAVTSEARVKTTVNVTHDELSPPTLEGNDPSELCDIIDIEAELPCTSGEELDEREATMRIKLGKYKCHASSKLSAAGGRKRDSFLVGEGPGRTNTSSARFRGAKNSGANSSVACLSFSHVQLSGLEKCVCCDSSWTTKKTDMQKIAHIYACARRNRITADTLRSLIKQELDTSISKGDYRSERSATAHRIIRERSVGTFVEDIFHKSTVVRPTKALQVSTIRNATENRNSILEKAKLFLDKQTNNDIGVDEDSLAPPCSMQAFGSSKLGIEGRSRFAA